MSSSNKIPRNIKLQLGFLHKTDKIIKQLFADILNDYTKRFDVKVTEDKVTIVIVGVSEISNNAFMGATFEGNDRYVIHVYDPSLDQESEPSDHRLVLWAFITTMCHEMVHVMQTLTGRQPKFRSYPAKDSEDPNEKYFFDPYEVEARILEGFYATKFGEPLRNYSESE